jgi:hypothetical protein
VAPFAFIALPAQAITPGNLLYLVFVTLAVYAQNLTGRALALILPGLVGATGLLWLARRVCFHWRPPLSPRIPKLLVCALLVARGATMIHAAVSVLVPA